MSKKNLSYILKRIILAILTVWVVITLTFFVMRAVPGGPFMSEKAITPAAQAAPGGRHGGKHPFHGVQPQQRHGGDHQAP